MKSFYIFDGMNINEQEIKFSHLKRGFLYGDGVFETLRAKENKVFMWAQHIKRLREGATLCKLQVPEGIDNLRGDIEKLLKKKQIPDAYIRMNLWRESPDIFDPGIEAKTHLLVIVRNYHSYPEMFYKEGIRCIISKNYFKNEKSPIVYIKSLNYLENILARIEARKNQCDDAIILNSSGYIASATVSNIFFVKKGKVYTPSLDCGILSGTIRRMVIKLCKKYGIEVVEGNFTLRDLKDVDEIFLTNTLMLVMPVKEVRGIFKSKSFRIADFLREEVNKKIID